MENKKYIGYLFGISETHSHFRALPYSGWGLILIGIMRNRSSHFNQRPFRNSDRIRTLLFTVV